MKKLALLVLLWGFWVSSVWADPYQLHFSLLDPYGGSFQITGTYTFEGSSEQAHAQFVYQNFHFPPVEGLEIIIDGTFQYYYYGTLNPETSTITFSGTSTLILGGDSIPFSIDMQVNETEDETYYSGSISLAGQTVPIDEELGELLEEIFFSFVGE